MHFPILHEITTAAISVANVVTGDVKAAGKVWEDYAEESVIGSTVASTGHLIAGDLKGAEKYGKGTARATGHALVGGGILPESVPGFKEFNKAGKALGDTMSGDLDQANKRFTKELVDEYNDPKFAQKTLLGLGTATVGAAVAIGTAGMGTAAMIATNTTANTATAAAVNAADQGIDIAAGRKSHFDGEALAKTTIAAAVSTAVVSTAAAAVSTNGTNESTTAAAPKTFASKGVSGFARETARQYTGIS